MTLIDKASWSGSGRRGSTGCCTTGRRLSGGKGEETRVGSSRGGICGVVKEIKSSGEEVVASSGGLSGPRGGRGGLRWESRWRGCRVVGWGRGWGGRGGDTGGAGRGV